MVGDNSLGTEVDPDLNEMEKGWNDGIDGNLIAYIDQKRIAPYLLKITSDKTSHVVSKEVMKYSEQNSSSIKVMEKVIADVKSMYPAKSYGLILWSHASGWLPASAAARTRAFGDDNGQHMEIAELAELSGKYDFFIFDACDMMGVETAYELRHNADYIVGSVTEVLGSGFPYHDIIEYLFKEDADVVSVCRAFMDYYKSHQTVQMQTAAISAVKTKFMDDLAGISRNLTQKHGDNINGLDVSRIQKYDSNKTTLFFDFLDFMENISENDPELQTLRNMLAETVIFEDHTPSILNLFDINRSCGLSCYIPGQIEILDYAYQKTSWYKATYGN
jgi:hypothetical protein